jgi:glycosyltransferase involved in cell wall biosynthesis
MKLALVIGSLQSGGTERQLVELVRGSHPRRSECLVICLGQEGPLAAEVRAAGARVVSVGARRLYDLRTLWVLARLLRRERPDVVYAFLFWGYSLALPLAWLVVPNAVRIQGRRSLPHSDVPSVGWLEPIRSVADRVADGVIANSIAVGSAVARHEPSLQGRIWVVPNGVRSHRRASGSHCEDVVIVCVANLIAYKGHATLLAAALALPPAGWRLELVGDGPERDRVQHTVAATGLSDRVSLLGRRDDVEEILSRADLAVLPSYTEGMPNTVMEAMAHGLPVVASDVGGVHSLLGGGAGLLVAPRDARALAHALNTLLADPGQRAALGARGAEIARELLSVDRMCAAAHQAFEQIAAERQDRRGTGSRWARVHNPTE